MDREEQLLEIRDILKEILDDACGEHNPRVGYKKRVWPIRAANYRTARKLLQGYRMNDIDNGGWLKDSAND